MTVTWLAGNRMLGTSTERLTTAGLGTAVGGWKELGRHTLGASGQLNLSSIPDKRYLWYLISKPSTGEFISTQLNADTGANYSRRYSNNGASDATNTGQISLFGNGLSFGAFNEFMSVYIANYSSKEKLAIGHLASGNTAGAGTAPDRWEGYSKWSNTTNVINRIQSQGTSLPSGSELVVLGYDPADTHSDNFWKELGSHTISSAVNTLDVSFTAKKYLWIQVYSKCTSANNPRMRFNADTGTNYSGRRAGDGGADGTYVSNTDITLGVISATESGGKFWNIFVINSSSNEKLVIIHSIETSGVGAGSAPRRQEHVAKWINTSSQATRIQIITDVGNHDVGSTLRVWGSD